jgi:hypothetical protein
MLGEDTGGGNYPHPNDGGKAYSNDIYGDPGDSEWGVDSSKFLINKNIAIPWNKQY